MALPGSPFRGDCEETNSTIFNTMNSKQESSYLYTADFSPKGFRD
jgi:hypothetical protein